MTVIETKVHRSSARNARLAFILTALVVGLLAATVAADRWHPILAALSGALLGVICGGAVWLLVRIWPVLVRIWWWLPEITLVAGLLYGFTVLARSTGLPARIAVVALVLGVPAAIGPVRRRIVAWFWCLVVRHRLRTCFTAFIIANASGTLPLILLARPTPVGERVWIYLRPGLSHNELNSRIDKIAVACHASTVVIERASERTAAFLRIDVKRREVLTATIDSPLPEMVDPHTPATLRAVGEVPTALDLPDVTTTPPAVSKPATTAKPVTPVNPAPSPRTIPPAAAAAASNGAAEDISDWI